MERRAAGEALARWRRSPGTFSLRSRSSGKRMEVAMKSSNPGLWCIGACAVCLSAYALAASWAGGYHLLRKIPLGAAEGGGEYFDYITVDGAARRVYLSHGTEVKVLNADSLTLVGTVTGLKRDHGVALIPDLGRGFITDCDMGQVII